MSHEQDVTEDDAVDPDLVEHTWQCDAPNCTATIEKQGMYSAAWADAKDEGWRCRPTGANGKVWHHYCPDHA